MLVTKQPVQGRYRRVLVPVDFTATSNAAVHMAVTVAPSARLHVFHALSPHAAARLRADVAPPLVREYEDRDRRAGMHRLRAIVASLGHAMVNVSVEQGHPAHLTLERQKKIRADLVVVGKNGRSAVVDFLLGSVANRALSDSPCDVLVIPAASVPGQVMGERSTGHDGAAPLFAPIPHRRLS
jgi:nucleotide-binding universal stress UspA family protein